MMTDFYDVFGDKSDRNITISPEVLEELNKSLPSNLMYLQDDTGEYRVVVRPDNELKLTTQFDLDPVKDADLIKKLNSIPYEKWPEYFYRSQKTIPIKNLKVGNDNSLIPVEQTTGNPFSNDQNEFKSGWIFPMPFPDPFSSVLECENGDSVVVSFQQQPYDSFTEIKFSNVDFPALKIDIYIYRPLSEKNEDNAKTNKIHPVSVTYSINPTKTTSVTETVKSLELIKGIFTGTTKMNGYVMVSEEEKRNLDIEKIDSFLAFWTTALKLEEKLGVKFIPSADFPREDIQFFKELDTCILKNKQIVWDHPFDKFHITDVKINEDSGDEKNIIDAKSLKLQFIEGPIPATLLGAGFNIYSLTTMNDMIVTNIQWDDETKKSGDVYISDAPGKTWTLKRLYMTEDQMNKFTKENKNKKAENDDVIEEIV